MSTIAWINNEVLIYATFDDYICGSLSIGGNLFCRYNTGNNFEQYKADYVTLYVNTIRVETFANDVTRPFVVSSPTNAVASEQEGFIATDPQNPFYGDGERNSLYNKYNYFFLTFVNPNSSLLQLRRGSLAARCLPYESIRIRIWPTILPFDLHYTDSH